MDIYDVLPTLQNDLRNDDRQWREIDQESFTEMLECLPPLATNERGFLSSEPYTHINEEGVYLSCIKSNERFLAAYLTLKEFKKANHCFF
jgi:hypothetical protein